MLTVSNLDARVSIQDQLEEQRSPIVLINLFTVAPDDIEALLTAWADDAAFMQTQPGYISTQLHRGIGGSCVFVNYAVWESVDDFKRAFTSPTFQMKMRQYPSSVTASPHLFQKLAVPRICVA